MTTTPDLSNLPDDMRELVAGNDEAERVATDVALYAILADIREAAGVGARPMLNALASEIRRLRERAEDADARVAEARREERERAASIVMELRDDEVCASLHTRPDNTR